MKLSLKTKIYGLVFMFFRLFFLFISKSTTPARSVAAYEDLTEQTPTPVVESPIPAIPQDKQANKSRNVPSMTKSEAIDNSPNQQRQQEQQKPKNTIKTTTASLDLLLSQQKSEKNEKRLPMQASPTTENMDHQVPFFSQAPYGYRGSPYAEACEEASILLAYYYVTGQHPTQRQFAEDLLQFIDREKKNLITYKSTDIATVSQAINALYPNLDYTIQTLNSADQIQQLLSQGKVIVAPFAGKKLKNPYYSNGGPVYHMMLIKGYTADGFIVHDVGTKRGENYRYSSDILRDALGDLHTLQKNVLIFG